MKLILFLIPLLIMTLFSCATKHNSEPTPFSLLPDSLQKEIEQEVLEEMKKEIIEFMEYQDNIYTNISPPSCSSGNYQNQFQLKKRSDGKILIRDTVGKLENIRGKVFLFYTANEVLDSEQTNKYIHDYDYEFYNYPFYSRISRDQIKSELEKSQVLLQEATIYNDINLEEFYRRSVKEWNDRLAAMNSLNVKVLKEIHISTRVNIDDKTQKSGFSSLTIQALHGMLDVRNWAAQKYFGESYLSLYFKATRYYNEEAKRKIRALEILYKLQISDCGYADSKGLRWDWYYEVAFPE